MEWDSEHLMCTWLNVSLTQIMNRTLTKHYWVKFLGKHFVIDAMSLPDPKYKQNLDQTVLNTHCDTYVKCLESH